MLDVCISRPLSTRMYRPRTPTLRALASFGDAAGDDEWVAGDVEPAVSGTSEQTSVDLSDWRAFKRRLAIDGSIE